MGLVKSKLTETVELLETGTEAAIAAVEGAEDAAVRTAHVLVDGVDMTIDEATDFAKSAVASAAKLLKAIVDVIPDPL